MRRFLVFALALATASVHAQGPKYGLKAGINFSNLTNTDWDYKAGFHGGGLAHIHVTPAFSLQPEIMYSNQGAKFSTGGVDYKEMLHYINVPVLLQYNFDNGFRLQGGPQLGVLVEAKRKFGNVEIDQSPAYKTLDFSIPIGVSYLGYSGFGVDARYNIGVSDVWENAATSRNGVFQLGLFYLLDHHHKARSK